MIWLNNGRFAQSDHEFGRKTWNYWNLVRPNECLRILEPVDEFRTVEATLLQARLEHSFVNPANRACVIESHAKARRRKEPVNNFASSRDSVTDRRIRDSGKVPDFYSADDEPML